MILSRDFVESVIQANMVRCAMARASGGIAAMALCEQAALPPPGWWFDRLTDYYLPPNVSLDGGTA